MSYMCFVQIAAGHKQTRVDKTIAAIPGAGTGFIVVSVPVQKGFMIMARAEAF